MSDVVDLVLPPYLAPDRVIERVAQAIYERMAAKDPEGRNYPWVPGGNSHKQNEAREYARAAIVEIEAMPPL